MSEFERADRLEREPTIEDVRQLMGASTPHFALHLRSRIRQLIEPLPEDIRSGSRASGRSGGSITSQWRESIGGHRARGCSRCRACERRSKAEHVGQAPVGQAERCFGAALSCLARPRA